MGDHGGVANGAGCIVEDGAVAARSDNGMLLRILAYRDAGAG
jgi:hypothetical protein